MKVSRGDEIFTEGDAADHFYNVAAGAVRLCKLLPDGRRQIAGFALQGDFFGIGNATVHGVTAEAIVDSELIRCSWRRVRRLCESHPALRQQLLSLTLESVDAMQRHLLAVGRMTVEERLSSFLLEMARRAGRKPLDGDYLDLPMGRRDIADHLGITIESVSRNLSRFKHHRFIAISDINRIELQDVRALQLIAGGGA